MGSDIPRTDYSFSKILLHGLFKSVKEFEEYHLIQDFLKMKFKGGRAEGKAVIAGLSCRLPKSDNIEEFWDNLINGKDMIGETRWPKGIFDTPPRVGLINDIDKFDAGFFKFTDTEAHNMNPLLRHLLEVSYECIADSGIPLSVLHSNITGTYTACFIPDNDVIETSRCADSKYCTTVSMITGHLMNQFRFTGPSATVDTACSSSVSAMEMAVADLMAGRCQFAMVTGCNLILNPGFLEQMCYLGMLSLEGQSRVFDADAKGYVRAEGIVSMLLTRQANICPRIYASVIDVKTNCNGYNPDGITFPSKDCQCALMKEVYRRSDIKPDDIAYMEMHSTGTPVGDPIEAESVTEAICSNRKNPLLVGSVKANMGHSEATAGLASLVKCILAARHGIIPPQRNFNTPNPKIDAIKDGKMVVVKEPTELKDGYIGLNSFGFGGANGHAILKPFRRKRKAFGKQCCLIPVTARTFQEQEAIKDFVFKNGGDPSLMAHLSSSLLSYDLRRRIRGFIITEPNSTELISKFVDQEPTCPELWLCLQDFIWDTLDFDPQLLNNGCFMKSIIQSQVIVKDKLGLKMVMTEALKLPVQPTTANGFIKAVSVLIGVVDCLQAAKVNITGVLGIGLAEIVACYVDNSFTREQCIRVAHIIGQALEDHTKNNAKDYKIYKVNLKLEDVYCLGSKVKVLTTLSDESAIIAITTGYTDSTLQLVHDKGGYYTHLTEGLMLYSRILDGVSEKVKDKVKVVIQDPKLRSGLMKNPKHLNQPQEHIDGLYIGRLLNRVVRANDIIKSTPAGVTLINVSLNGVQAGTKKQIECIDCKSSPVSVLKTLGEIHIRGHPVDVSVFYQTDFPLDVKSPSISSLIKWDHSYSWAIPEWPEFYANVRDEAVMPYTIDLGDSEGIHTPIATLIYHSWLAISQKTTKDKITESISVLDKGITFSNLDLNTDSNVVNDLIQGAVVQVLQGKQRFAVHNNGTVLFSGNYKLSSEKLALPKIPGYDLDINENIEDDSDLLQKTEILWEDNWLDFINTVLEFNMEYFETGLIKVMIDPASLHEEVKDCANVLAVTEKYTGLCKAGSFLVQNLVESKSTTKRTTNVGDYNTTAVKNVLAYSIQSIGSDKILIYQGSNGKSKCDVLGIVLMTDEEVICKEIPLSPDDKWQTEDIEQIVPYLIALYLISESAEITQKPRILICPPIDTVAMYLMALASEEPGLSVFTSSYDVETRQMIESTFPFVCVLPGDNLVQSIKSLTQGEGCDVCIKFTSGELNSCFDLIGSRARFLQCAKPLESLDLEKLQQGKTLILVDVKKAFLSFLCRSLEEIQTLLFQMKDGIVGKLKEEGYPETRGLLYSLDERSQFLDPISIIQIVNMLDEPGVDMTGSFKSMMEADMLAMERLHNVITTKPKDFSLWEKCQSDSQNSQDDTLNEARLVSETSELKISQITKDTVMIRVPNVVIIPPDQKDGESLFPPTSTPMVTGDKDRSDDLHESYIDIQLSDSLNVKPMSKCQFLPPQPMIITPVPMMKKRKRSKPVDLVIINSPGLTPYTVFTPMTPAIKTLLTPVQKEPSLVPLNTVVNQEKSLYIVHPITGRVTLLKTLGGLLTRRCYGIQRTATTPRDSIPSVASYYNNAVQMLQPSGSYIIAGYSFGSVVALEMAFQLQANKKKVDKLILLDGGPGYFKSQFKAGVKAAKDENDLEVYLEIGALVNFLMMYIQIPSISLVQNILYQLPTKEARIQTIVEMSMNNVAISKTPVKTKWLSLKEKVFKDVKEKGKNQMADVAQEVLTWRRREQAADFIKSVKMVNSYKNDNVKFKGDIHLLRIKTDPVFCEFLPVDYGLQDCCTGKVHIKFFNGSHETFLNQDSDKEVAEEITKILSTVK